MYEELSCQIMNILAVNQAVFLLEDCKIHYRKQKISVCNAEIKKIHFIEFI